MASPRKKTLFATAAAVAVGVTGYYLYSAFAVQGQGTLAQAPLNIQVSVPPAFIMAVDDSGSMTFQTQFPGQDGQACFDGSGWFDAAGAPLTSGNCSYFYVLPGPRISGNYFGIPPLDSTGFARSPEYNPTYFNPAVTYLPWLNSNGTPYGATEENPKGNASTSATRIDPRYTPSVNLAAWRSGDSFRIRNGMRVAKGTVYTWWGKTYTAGSAFNWNAGAGDIDVQYWPATFYLKWTSDEDGYPPGYESVARVKVDDACGTGCAMWRYTIDAVENPDALQNFANWYSFYGNRNRAMVAGMTRSLYEVNNMRVGYFTINQHASFDDPINNTNERVTMYDMADYAVGGARSKLFEKLLALPANGSTPNRQAVQAAGKQFTRTDGAAAPVTKVCQKNAAMLFTDGFSNQDGPTVGNVDSTMGAPFQDGNSNTMADIVTQYYLDKNGQSPLRTDLTAGKVPIPEEACKVNPRNPKLDCQTNLHMNFYGVTLGAKGIMYDPSIPWDSAYTNSAIYNNWPARQNDNRSTVDDIWHAAVNTRGEYINARTPADIIAAMRRILQQVGAGATPSGSIGLTGARVGTGSWTVIPFYESTNNGTDWYSTLTGAEVSKDTKTGALVYTNKWEASTVLPAPATRALTTWFGTTTGSVVPTTKLFKPANLGAKPFVTLCSNSFARCNETKFSKLGASETEVVDFLLGDQSLQAKKNQSVKLRDRTTPLGDIVNSSPVVSTPNMDDYGYAALRGTDADSYDPYNYTNYLKNTKKNRSPMVYVGANDGMLHGFDAKTGIEKFAYIPATAVGHMGNLAFPYNVDDKNDQTFSHRYYVDGPITVSDAIIGSAWRTVLVGTAGAGGRSVFALNVSNPNAFKTASNVLWELNDSVSNTNIKDNIGYVLGKPVIVPVKIGTTVKWKAVFGNGYASKNGKATLFVVDMQTGAVEFSQATETGAGAPTTTTNGLGNIIVIDRWLGSSSDAGRDGYADTVYGGDQNGAVWKFDLRTAKPTIGVDGKPLFVAKDASGNRQPILGGFEAASGPMGGVMLYFGTGSFSFDNDQSDNTMQTIYGVLDNFSTTPVSGRTQLLKQEIQLEGDLVRTVTKNTGLGKMGWYMDLGVSGTSGTPTAEGERFVGNPVIANGIVFFPTYDPSTTVNCGTSGNNWLYGLNALTGGAALNGVRVGEPNGKAYDSATGAVKLESPGTAPIKDVAVLATPRQGILSKGDDPTTALGAQCSMVVQVAGAPPLYLPRPCGRQSWRQVL